MLPLRDICRCSSTILVGVRLLNGRRETVAVTKLLDDVRGGQKNVPFSKPILAVGVEDWGLVVKVLKWSRSDGNWRDWFA